MDQFIDPQAANTDHSLALRREAKGYTHEELAIATGLTIDEIVAAEEGGGSSDHIARIESVLG